MSDDMALSSLLALVIASAWSSGINVYAVLLVLGFASDFHYLLLPEGLDFLDNSLVIVVLVFLYCVEFIADKIPGVDSGWDFLHTFIRIPLAFFVIGAFFEQSYPEWESFAQWLAAMVALTSHITKASARLLINASPEPFSNWGASITEDILVFTALWLALTHPYLFFIFIITVLAIIVWLLPKIFRAIGLIFAKIRAWLRGASAQA